MLVQILYTEGAKDKVHDCMYTPMYSIIIYNHDGVYAYSLKKRRRADVTQDYFLVVHAWLRGRDTQVRAPPGKMYNDM